MFDYEGPEPYETSVYNGDDNSDPGFTSDGPDVQPINFWSCPLCNEPLEIASQERLYGFNQLKLTIEPDGQLKAAEWTTTEVDFNSSTTIDYHCCACQMELPERYQELIDSVLNNYRQEDE